MKNPHSKCCVHLFPSIRSLLLKMCHALLQSTKNLNKSYWYDDALGFHKGRQLRGWSLSRLWSKAVDLVPPPVLTTRWQWKDGFLSLAIKIPKLAGIMGIPIVNFHTFGAYRIKQTALVHWEPSISDSGTHSDRERSIPRLWLQIPLIFPILLGVESVTAYSVTWEIISFG